MRKLAPAVLAIALSACASTDSPSGEEPVAPAVQLVQIVGPADLQYPRGDMEVQFGMRVTNGAPDEMKLRRVQLSSVGDGGPYRLVTQTYNFDVALPPATPTDVKFWARAVARGNPQAVDARAPVTVRGVFWFEKDGQPVRRVVTASFEQGGAGR